MTDLSERTDHPGHRDLSPSPEQHPAAGPPEIHFVPIEGERLEHLATERRGPLRWTASAVLSVQALVRKGPSAPAPLLEDLLRQPSPGPHGTGRRRHPRAEAAVARRRRARRAQRARQAQRASGASAPAPAPVRAPAPAVRAPAPAPTVPEPMPGSGWSWNADDEQSWEAWEANVTAGDTDRRLESLDTDLERPLPAAVRMAQFLGGRRRPRRWRPAGDDA